MAQFISSDHLTKRAAVAAAVPMLAGASCTLLAFFTALLLLVLHLVSVKGS